MPPPESDEVILSAEEKLLLMEMAGYDLAEGALGGFSLWHGPNVLDWADGPHDAAIHALFFTYLSEVSRGN